MKTNWNWANKEERAEQAREHTKEMDKLYRKKIEDSVEKSIIYDVEFKSKEKSPDYDSVKIMVEPLDSVSAIAAYHNKCRHRMAVLNFSSYKNPGGMFINGSRAQEECLCHASFLYNVLIQFKSTFYEWNNQHKNRALYSNRGIYSPNILFLKDKNEIFCDVITCAAPNKSAAQRYQKVSEKENAKVLRERIAFVLDIAKDNKVDTLILGAYGCGVFGQNAKEVADIFKEYFNTTHKCFENVIFAIPKGRDKNFEVFEQVFNS